MIIKEKKSRLNIKYIWLIKIKPKINRGVISFFHSISKCFSNRHKKYKDKRERKREKKIDEKFRSKLDTNYIDQNDFSNPNNNNNNNNNNLNNYKNKSSKKYNNEYDNEFNEYNNINVPINNNYNYNNGEVSMDKKYFEELNQFENQYEFEKNQNPQGLISNQTKFKYAKILSHSQNKDNRKKSIELLLELLNSDENQENKEKYLIELGTTYYKQEDFDNAKIYADKVLQSSPLNRQALSLKYLTEPIPIEVKS